ncbi:MAG: hypothetical protein AABZ47_09665 [Planctomycetota bacterium]
MMSFPHTLALSFGPEPMSVTQSILLAFGVIGLLAVGFSAMRKGRKVWEPRPTNVRDRDRSSRNQAETLRNIEAAMTQLDELARQITGRIDAKLSQLDIALREADVRIDSLSRRTRSANGQETVDVTLEDESRVGLSMQPSSSVSPDPHQPVYQLADSGLAPIDVAQELGRPTGEVELILALRRTRDSADGDRAVAPGRLQSPHAA